MPINNIILKMAVEEDKDVVTQEELYSIFED
jgi:hypothetical protein